MSEYIILRVQEYPEIWDMSNENFKNKDKKMQLLNLFIFQF